MAVLRRLVHPRSWPVRWRLAAGSAGLTLAILLVFAAVIGHLTTERIRNDFNREMHEAADNLAAHAHVTPTPEGLLVKSPELNDFALPNGAVVRIFDTNGGVHGRTRGSSHLGPPRAAVTHVGNLRVISAPITSPSGQVVGYVQYGRSEVHDEVGELARTLEQMLRSLDAARTEREQAMQK